MATTTVRVTEETHAKLSELAHQTGKSMQDVLDRAVEEFRRSRIIAETNARYAELRADPIAWAEIEGARALWDTTVADNLEPEPTEGWYLEEEA